VSEAAEGWKRLRNKPWASTRKSWRENLERVSTAGVSKGGGWPEYLLTRTGGVGRGGIPARPAATGGVSLLPEVQLRRSFAVRSQVTGVFVRCIVTPG